MKKLPFVFLLALVIVYLCACGAAGPAVRAAITAPPADTPVCAAEQAETPRASGVVVLRGAGENVK